MDSTIRMMVSVIIPVYNEEKTITDCLKSLSEQSYSDMEIIVVDDGSNDNSKLKIKSFNLTQDKKAKLPFKKKNLILLSQSHQGPGSARNYAATYARGEILVFVDADMTFHKDFIKKLTEPIISKQTRGTFTRAEYVSNWDNVWARLWNYNNGIPDRSRIPKDYPDQSPVFRAILKSEFGKVGGFDDIGFTDDWTLSRKLGYTATVAHGAICYHTNPDSLKEVYLHSRWIGKNEFISGTISRRVINLFRFNPITAFILGIIKMIRYKELRFLIFSFVYNQAIFQSIILSFAKEPKSK